MTQSVCTVLYYPHVQHLARVVHLRAPRDSAPAYQCRLPFHVLGHPIGACATEHCRNLKIPSIVEYGLRNSTYERGCTPLFRPLYAADSTRGCTPPSLTHTHAGREFVCPPPYFSPARHMSFAHHSRSRHSGDRPAYLRLDSEKFLLYPMRYTAHSSAGRAAPF